MSDASVKNPMASAGLRAMRLVGALLALAIALSLIVALNRRLQRDRPQAPVEEQAAARTLDAGVYRIVSAGHLPSLIDWMWIQVALAPDVRRTLYPDLKLITDLDPFYFDVYHAGAHILTILRSEPEGARDLLIKADRVRRDRLPSASAKIKNEYWSTSWGIPLLLGYVYLFELSDLPNASTAFIEAARVPGAPAYLQSLEKRLLKPDGQYEVGLRLLNFMIGGAKDDRARDRLEKKREALFISRYLFELNLAFKTYLAGEPEYRRVHEHRPEKMKEFFKGFLSQARTDKKDPWGGTLFIAPTGKIDTTTPREKVFGLD